MRGALNVLGLLYSSVGNHIIFYFSKNSKILSSNSGVQMSKGSSGKGVVIIGWFL